MEACIENYAHPSTVLPPFIPSIWNSLKYEVRNGEVAETVQGAISVLRAIARRLQDDSARLNEYIHMVFRDSLDDLAEPDYVKQAGQICLAVISSSPQAFVSHSPKLVDSVIQKIPQFKSAAYTTYTRDLLDILEAILKARWTLVHHYPNDDKLIAAKSATHFQNLFNKVYLPLWQNHVSHAEGPELGVLKAITSGVAALVTQEIVLSDGTMSLLCSVDVCKEICSLFTHRLLMPLTLSPRDAEAMVADVDIGLQQALSTVVTHYMDGFQMLAAATTDAILDRDWKTTEKRFIDHLWQVLCQVSFIGCVQLPTAIGLTSAKKKYSPLHHFMTWTGALLQLTESFLADGADPRVVKLMVAGLHHSMFFLREGCGTDAQQVNLHPGDEESLDWAKEFKIASAGATIPSEWLRLLYKDYRDIHDQVWRNNVEDVVAAATGTVTEAIVSSSQDVFANFIRLCLFIVRHLFRRVTKETQDSDGKVVLHLAHELAGYTKPRRTAILEQIEGMTSETIRAMDARSQRFYQLPTEAFRLFSNCKVAMPYWSMDEDGALNLLTLSILKGLWPDAMTDLVSLPSPIKLLTAMLTRHSTIPAASPKPSCATMATP
jgi:DNA repair/transcription protein MET18/MMS19